MIDATADTHDPGRDDCDEQLDDDKEIARRYAEEHGVVEPSDD